jgi:hypothetical protein
MALFGESVRGLHLLAILMAVLAAACGVLLARRFTRHPVVAMALVFVSPAVLPIANLMVDVPALALGLASAVVFVGAVDRRSWPQAALGGLLTALAVLTKYNAVVLVPLFALYALLRGRARYLTSMAIPVAVLGLWSLHNAIVWGEVHLLITSAYKPYEKTAADLWQAFYTAAVVPGSSFFFLGVLGLARLRLRGLAVWGWLAAVLLIGPTHMYWWRSPTLIATEYWAFAANTVLLLVFASAATRGLPEGPRRPLTRGLLLDLVRRGPASPAESDRRDSLFLWLWIAGVMLFQMLFAFHQAPRYHILALSPLALLLIRTLDAAVPSFRPLHHAAAWGSVAVGLVMALFVAAADDAHARANRELPARVSQKYGAEGGKIYCVGHWGFQFYCEELGFTAFDAIGGEVAENDLVIVPENNQLSNLPKAFEPLPTGKPLCAGDRPLLQLVEEVVYPRDRAAPAGGEFFGTRLLGAFQRLWPFSVSPMHHSRLYAANVPQLPYSWRNRGSDSADERFAILRARCDYKIAQERLTIDFSSFLSHMHMVSGWAEVPVLRDGVWGLWNVGHPSVFVGPLDHRNRAYVLRVRARSVRHPEGEPVRATVWINRVSLGELSFTPEVSTEEILVPGEMLSAEENEFAFTYSYQYHPIGEMGRAILFYRIDLYPLSAPPPPSPSPAAGEPTG